MPNGPPAPAAELTHNPHRVRLRTALNILCVLGVYCLAGAWQVPDENETHYLVKARHFADHRWVAGDLFAESADVHWTFYAACGRCTRWLSLDDCARLGRILTWTAIAWGWCRLGRALELRPGAIVLAAGMQVVVESWTRFSGEWMIGGFEAKGPAYACVLAACAALIQARWTAVWPWLGAAIAWHPLVGGWATVISAGLACCEPRSSSAGQRWPGGALLLGGALAGVGLLPPLWAEIGVPNAMITEARRIYVFERLPHHLVPQAFAGAAVARCLAAVLLWLVLAFLVRRGVAADSPRAARQRRWHRLVSGSLLLAIVGGALGFALENHPDLAASLLRGYWFRLADVMLPWGASLALVQTLAVGHQRHPRWAASAGAALVILVAWQLGQTAYAAHRLGPRSEEMIAADRRADWVAACEWIREHTPPEARVLTPPFVQTFKWRAERAEVVNWKDVPQDARSMVVWWERMTTLFLAEEPGKPIQPAATTAAPPNTLPDAVTQQPTIRAILDHARQRRWIRSLTQLPVEQIHALAPRYGYEFCLTSASPALAMPVAYRNNSFAVYHLTPESPDPPR